jgi:nifR3 family TIM-barrel protein
MPSPPAIRIDSLVIDYPIGQAALSGYSDWPMRVIARRLGAGFTICEVLLDQFVVNVTKGRKAKKYLRVSEEEHPVGGQLMGALPEMFPPAALKLVEAGFDWVDLNFGCPVKKVLGKCRGGYLLSQPETALEIVARVREALPPTVPLSLKMRRGLDDSQKSIDDFYAIFDGALSLGVAAITVHGRTVRQRYTGRSSWQFLREVKQHAGSHVVLGSGDLFTAQDCFDMIAATGVDGVTVARGAIGNPWIFQQTRALAGGQPLPPPPSLFAQRDVIADHYRLAEQIYGPQHACGMMRNFGIKYSVLHPQSHEVRDAFIRVRNPQHWEDVLRQWYAEDRPGRCFERPTREEPAA